MTPPKIKTFIELIKFEHTIFALPFAYIGMISAARGWSGWGIFFWVTLAMATARTAGMTLNRIIDVEIDRKNPRTARRALVTGDFKVLWAWGAVGVALILFFLSAARLNRLCLALSPIALFFLVFYHYVKRFSFLCHFTLGMVLAIAPAGGWLAVTGAFDWRLLVLAPAVLVWVAGFDILYALQDVEFDRENGLHSIPVQFGRQKALEIARFCHLATAVFLALFGLACGYGWIYFAGVAIAAGLLWMEHRLIREGDLSKIDLVFFTINGWVGVLLLVFTFMENYR